MRLLAALLIAIIFGYPVQAGAQKNMLEFSPPHCDFSITFPAPYTIEPKCENNGMDCYDLVCFINGFNDKTQAKIQVICNASPRDYFDRYTPEAVVDTVIAIKDRTALDMVYRTGHENMGQYKAANLIAESEEENILYIAQFMISEQSMMTIEATLSGQENAQADQMVSNILGSVAFDKKAPSLGK